MTERNGRARVPWGREDWLALVLLLAVTLVFHGPLFVPRGGPIERTAPYAYPEGDFYDQFHAFAVYEHDRLWAGELPLWNPYTLGGHPFWADVQAAVLYPPSLLTMALSGPGEFSPVWLEAEAAVHFYLGALWTYLFARRLLHAGRPRVAGWRRAVGPLVAALTFAFGGYLAGYPSQQLAVLETQVWLPLLLLLLDVGLTEGSARAIVGAGLAWGVALLAGHPQSAMYVLYVALLYGLARSWQLKLGWVRAGLAQLAWVGMGLGLAAVQWLPAYEFMRLSVRSSLSYEELAGGLALRDLVQFLAPDVYTYWSPMYVGILPLVLALAGCWGGLKQGSRGRRAMVVFWLVLALVSLVLSLGGNAFLYRFFYWVVPGFRLFRSQERAIYVTSLALAVLAGYGWEWLADERTEAHSVRRLSRMLLALGAASLAMLALVWLRGERAGLAQEAWLKPVGFGAGLLWASWALARWVPRRSGWAAALALSIVCVDLAVVNAPRNLKPGAAGSRVYDSGWLEAVLQDEGLYRTANEWGLPGNAGCLLRREDLYGASPLRLQAHRDLADGLPRWRFWQLFGVRYVMTWEHDCPAPFACHRIAMRGDEWAKNTVYLHRIEPRYDRAWVVHRARVVADGEALAQLADPAFDPFAEVLLPRAPDGFAISEPEGARSTAGVIESAPERLAVRAEMAAPGWLVVGEWYYPGWQARVDGRRADIYRVDYGLRAVPLEAGAHVVEFEYRPLTLYAGAILSLVTLLAAAVVWGVCGRGGDPVAQRAVQCDVLPD